FAKQRRPKIDLYERSTMQIARIKSLYVAEPYTVLTCILLTALSAIAALTYDKHGFAIDEDPGYLRALRTIEFISSAAGKTDDIARFEPLNYYGAMPDVLALLAQRLVPALSFDARHLIGAMFGLGGIYYAYRFSSLFVSPAVGFFAALFLACNPMWFGYMF